MSRFEKNREKWINDWDEAFQENGRNAAASAALVQEAVTWATNNPDMTWEDIFDAVILADEVD